MSFDSHLGDSFQSTPPARGATTPMEVVNLYFDISIHAPREGGDLIVNTITKDCLTNFNPRPPRGGRQQRCTVLPADL